MNNRIIKFRVWDREKKAIVEIGEMNVGLALSAWLKDGERSYMVIDGETADFMQFTGLLDKNGKEIYEGDIGKLMLDKIVPKYALCICEWSDEYGSVSWIQKKLINIENPSRGWAIHVKGFEVIGNIFETPELLT